MFIRQVMHGVAFGAIALLMMSGSANAKVQANQLVPGAEVTKTAAKDVKSSDIKVARNRFRQRGFNRRHRFGRNSFRHRRGLRRPGIRFPRSRNRRYRRHRRPIIVVPRSYYYDDGPTHGSSCNYWHRRCVDSWGYGNKNYRGCLRYHRCY